MVENKEIRFEQDIETSLTTYGKWQKETFSESNFDPTIGLDYQKLLSFIQKTQPKQWARHQRNYRIKEKDLFLQTVSSRRLKICQRQLK